MKSTVPRCGAKTRRGARCQAAAIWSTRSRKYTHCKNHGGLSTGPKTAEGIERIRQAVTKHGGASFCYRDANGGQLPEQCARVDASDEHPNARAGLVPKECRQKEKKVRRVALLVVLSGMALGQDITHSEMVAGDGTIRMNNGRFWALLSAPDERTTYLVGISNGIILACVSMEARIKTSRAKAEGGEKDLCQSTLYPRDTLIFSEVASQVSELYKDPANLALPIVQIYMVARARLAGASDKEIAVRLEALRIEHAEITSPPKDK